MGQSEMDWANVLNPQKLSENVRGEKKFWSMSDENAQ